MAFSKNVKDYFLNAVWDASLLWIDFFGHRYSRPPTAHRTSFCSTQRLGWRVDGLLKQQLTFVF